MFRRYPDVACPACQTPNRWTRPRCKRCGAELDHRDSSPRPPGKEAWVLVAVLVIGLLVGALLTAFGAANWDYAQCQRDVLSEIEVLAYCFVPGSLVMAMGLLIVTASVVGLLVVAPSIPVDSTADSGAGEVGAAQRDGGSWLPFVLTAAVAVVAVAVAIALGRWG